VVYETKLACLTELWLLCAVVVLVAIVGKYVGTYSSSRLWYRKPEASALGWLMNTRGLTELIVLNIGLSLGVISPLTISGSIMALVTTFMTSPAGVDLSEKLIKLDMEPEAEETGLDTASTYRICAGGKSEYAKGLLQLAVAIAGSRLQPAVVHPLTG